MTSDFVTFQNNSEGKSTDANKYFLGNFDNLSGKLPRKKRLENYVQLKASDEVDLTLSDQADTAAISMRPEQDSYQMTLPTDADFENPYDEVDDDTLYSMLMFAWIIHESGHYHYTDQPTRESRQRQLKQNLSDYPPQVKQSIQNFANSLWNAFEDAAIEEALRNENGANVAHRLAMKNEIFIGQSRENLVDSDTENIGVEDAARFAAMDLGKYDTGVFRRLLDDTADEYQFVNEEEREFFLDEIFPIVKQTVINALTTPDTVQRQHILWDHVESICEQILEFRDFDEISQPEQPNAQQMGGDANADHGKAQKQRSEGLDENSRQEIAQRQAETSQQTIQIQTQGEDGGDGDDGDGEGDEDVRQQSGQNGDEDASGDNGGPGEEGEGVDSEEGNSTEDSPSNGTGEQNSTNGQQGQSTDGEADCPSCNSSDVERKVQTVGQLIAARVNAPFPLDAAWIDTISFVKNDEICGFRIQTSGTVPRESIETNGYKVVDVPNGVEILEPRNRYDEQEQVNGFSCNNCGNEWVPVIGGGSA